MLSYTAFVEVLGQLYVTDLAKIENQLAYITVRITTIYSDGSVGFGSGFLFNFPAGEEKNFVVLFTNKHVIAGSERVLLKFTCSDDNEVPNDDDHFDCNFETKKYALLADHPDPEVDLCVIGVGPALNHALKQNKNPFVKSFAMENIATVEQRMSMTAVENVLMIGYPNGLYDSKSNFPIIRKGITATPLFLDHEGRPEFVVDAPCFPGSSGSPIVRYNSGALMDDGKVTFGTKLSLVGILYAGPYLKPDGSFEARHIPTTAVGVDDLKIMINLGYCIHAEKILDFLPIMKKWGAVL